MVKSMTGYGRYEYADETKDVTLEIKSVNHRYLDVSVRLPRSLTFMEDRIKKLTSGYVSRGKVDVNVNFDSAASEYLSVGLDAGYARGYIEALYRLRDEFGLTDDVTVSKVAHNRDIFDVRKAKADDEALFEIVKGCLDKAFRDYDTMKVAEGERLEAFFRESLDTVKALVAKVRKLSPKTVEAYGEKMRQRINELLGGTPVDEARLLTECAIFADRIAVDEETVRLDSHIGQFYGIMDENAPSGRKLDFLLQEMNREANTIGSKANDSEITKIVIELKSELEKIREQVQNIE